MLSSTPTANHHRIYLLATVQVSHAIEYSSGTGCQCGWLCRARIGDLRTAMGGVGRQNGSRPFEPVIGQIPAHDLARPPAIHGPAGSHGAKRLELAGERLVAGVFGEYPVVVCPAAGAAFLL